MEVKKFDEILTRTPLAALYLDKDERGLCAGIAVFERYGMGGWVYEVHSDASHPYSALDKLFHLIFVSGSSQLIVSASSKTVYDEVAGYFEPFRIHYSAEIFNSETQNALFREVFDLRSLLTPLEHFCLEERLLSAQALAHLASAYRQSSMLPIAIPEILDSDGLLEIGNNALEQLEIVSSDPRVFSISKFFIAMRTPMGQRLGRFRLLLPIRDKDELNRRYDWAEWVSPHIAFLSSRLQEVGDIQIQWRQLCRFVPGDTVRVSFESALSSIGSIRTYCADHKLLVLSEWDFQMQSWFEELKLRLREPLWLAKQSFGIGKLIDFIARLDIAVTTADSADRYGLCRPVIVDTRKGENFLQIMGLRHLLVERQGNGYVPNDIVMGSRDYLDLPYPTTVMLDPRVHDGADIRGVMLYGINSSGKSSLMKSIGIAVVLAQAGYYVPAKAMKFSLFDGVFTRIVSHDKVARSLSTFGVEMLELNAIFSHAGAKTLILGDEISHGTETLSAVAIVASTVMELAKKGALFILTTHLHQLSMIKELSTLREVVSLHLSVWYEESDDRLVYERRLQPGRGSSIYGLEFARSLHMDKTFLHNAKRLREHLAKEYDILELGHRKETIKRYREVVACECVICGTLVRNQPVSLQNSEHHHLIALCDVHRRSMAEGKIKVQGFIMTPQGLRLEYETQLEGI